MIGKTISHYKIIEKLGEGGMGVVYKAEDTKLKRTVALKFLPPELTRDPESRKRFIHEAQAASTLEHNNICNIHEIDETEDGQQFIVMAFYAGETLKQKIKRGPLSIDQAIDMAIEIGAGLAKAHAAKILHRDIKPANILVTNDNVVKIVDFGLAKLSGPTQLTKEGITLGTAAYMSPEQARGEKVDHRTDIWSFGVVLYEMLTGEIPFKGDYEQAVVYSILNEEPEPMENLRNDVPTELQQVVKKAMQRDAGERYQHAHELLAELESAKKKLESKKVEVRGKQEKPSPSIAVLPFVDMSPQKDQEYFCDGIAEELINVLTNIQELRVVARTSAFSFKGKDLDVREIGKKLNVETVLEGSVRKAANRLRITAQLVNVADGYHLWSEKYDRELEDIFAIQDEISLAIVEELKIKLLGDEKKALVKRHTDNLEAYNLFLKGRYYFNKQNPGGFEKAIQYFEQAIEKDPNHAVAFAGLADAYWWGSFFGDLRPRQTYPKAREAAKKAIEIDDTLGEAHASLASIHTFYDWDWEAAEREFKRALELAPGSSYTRVYYSLYLNLKRRHDEAVAQAKKAQELDPLSSFSNTHLGHRLWQARRYDEAIEEFEKWLVIEPNDGFAHLHLGVLYQEKGMIEEAIAEIEKGVELSGGVAIGVKNAIMTHFRFGSRDVAERLFDDLKERARHEYIPPICFVYVHLVRGETDQAFEWARKAYEERDGFLVWLRVTPFDSLHLPSEPRIDELMDRLGLP